MAVTVRLARTPEDIHRICELVSQMSPGVPHDYREAAQKFEKAIKHNTDYFLWVAEDEGVIVGTAMMHLQHKLSYHCGCAAHLEDLVVDKEYRGRGYSRHLLEEALKVAKEQGCYKLILGCFERTVSYYEHFGFKRNDVGMKYVLKDDLYPAVGE